jgi:Ca-activated chloride channel homolog
VIEYNTKPSNASAPLIALYPAEGSFWHDYQLCTSDAAWTTAAHRAAINMFAEHITSGELLHEAVKRGFRASKSASYSQNVFGPDSGINLKEPQTSYLPAPGDVTEELLSRWQELEHPAAIVYVFDSSVHVEGEIFERTRAQLKRLLSTNRSGNLAALIVLSFEAKLEAPLSGDTKAAINVANKLTPQGGASILDGLRLAFTTLAKKVYALYRKVVVLITKGHDSNSRTSFASIDDALFTDPFVDLQIFSISKGEAAENEPPREISALSHSDQVIYHDIPVERVEIELENLRQRL